MKVLISFLFVTLIISEHVNAAFGEHMKECADGEDCVHISPKCAAVLFAGGTVVGGTTVAALSALVGPVLALLGFELVGVEAGSFAAWWQSTFPLVEKGSTFSALQSIAMKGVGSTVMAGSGSIGGGAFAATKIHELCTGVDGIDPESNEGKFVSTLLWVVGEGWELTKEGFEHAKSGTIHVWEHVKDFPHEIGWVVDLIEGEKW